MGELDTPPPIPPTLVCMGGFYSIFRGYGGVGCLPPCPPALLCVGLWGELELNFRGFGGVFNPFPPPIGVCMGLYGVWGGLHDPSLFSLAVMGVVGAHF